MSKDSEVPSRRRFLWEGGVALGALGGLGGVGLGGMNLFRNRAQLQGCPTGAVGPMDCSPPAGYNSPVPWKPDPTLPMRTRWSAFDPAGKANVVKLNNAYAAMRKLSQTNPADPRGWMQQANVHCWYCGGGQNGTEGPEIHGCWWFFAWHRCYLYFHERALASLIKDPTVSLMYWNWDDTAVPAHQHVPPIFYTGSLNDVNREATPTEAIDTSYVSGLTPSDPDLLQANTANWFGANPGNQPPSNGGVLENGPHGIVHLWTGAANESDYCTNSPAGGKPDMGVLATAAQDPVFFAHHSNIDRLWDVWLSYQVANKTGQTNPAWPSTQGWTFYNANLDGTGQWVTMNIASVINHQQTLRYQYAPPPAAQVVAAAQTPGQPIPLGSAPVTQTIPVPDEVRTKVAAVESVSGQAGHTILNVELTMSSNEGALVHVFGNLPGATAETSTGNPNYLGYFAIVAKGGREHTMTKHVIVDVTRKLPGVLKGASSLAVTLVPKAGPRAGVTATPPRMQVTRIYLTRG